MIIPKLPNHGRFKFDEKRGFEIFLTSTMGWMPIEALHRMGSYEFESCVSIAFRYWSNKFSEIESEIGTPIDWVKRLNEAKIAEREWNEFGDATNGK